MSQNQNNSAQFLMAEFSAIQNRIASFEQIKSSRVNFFLFVVGAVAAGLSAILQVPTFLENALLVITFASMVLFLLGVSILHHLVSFSIAIVTLYRKSGRIRRWFFDENPSIAPFLVFEPADDKPRYDLSLLLMTWRGAEPVLVVLNAMLFAVFVITAVKLLTSFESNFVLMVLLISIGLLTWFIQLYIIKLTLAKRQNRLGDKEKSTKSISGVIFPYNEEEFSEQIEKVIKKSEST